jgi:hypothetical protein
MPPHLIAGSSSVVQTQWMHTKAADAVAPAAPVKFERFTVVLEKGDGCDGEQSGQSLGRTGSSSSGYPSMRTAKGSGQVRSTAGQSSGSTASSVARRSVSLQQSPQDTTRPGSEKSPPQNNNSIELIGANAVPERNASSSFSQSKSSANSRPSGVGKVHLRREPRAVISSMPRAVISSMPVLVSTPQGIPRTRGTPAHITHGLEELTESPILDLNAVKVRIPPKYNWLGREVRQKSVFTIKGDVELSLLDLGYEGYVKLIKSGLETERGYSKDNVPELTAKEWSVVIAECKKSFLGKFRVNVVSTDKAVDLPSRYRKFIFFGKRRTVSVNLSLSAEQKRIFSGPAKALLELNDHDLERQVKRQVRKAGAAATRDQIKQFAANLRERARTESIASWRESVLARVETALVKSGFEHADAQGFFAGMDKGHLDTSTKRKHAFVALRDRAEKTKLARAKVHENIYAELRAGILALIPIDQIKTFDEAEKLMLSLRIKKDGTYPSLHDATTVIELLAGLMGKQRIPRLGDAKNAIQMLDVLLGKEIIRPNELSGRITESTGFLLGLIGNSPIGGDLISEEFKKLDGVSSVGFKVEYWEFEPRFNAN